MLFYNDVLFAAMKIAHGSEEALEEIPLSIMKEEMRTRQKLESIKRKVRTYKNRYFIVSSSI